LEFHFELLSGFMPPPKFVGFDRMEISMRKEIDKLGEVTLEDDNLYGIQTARAKENFSLNYRRTNLRLIYAIVKVKKAAAITLLPMIS
jgi:aspartate ammonia-lyase